MIDPAAIPGPLRAALLATWGRIEAALHDDGRALLERRVAVDPAFGRALARVLCCSAFVAQSLEQHPELLPGLVASGELDRARTAADYREWLARELPADCDEATLGAVLRRLRRREMVRIVWRDLTRTATLAGTMRELGWLAEATLDAALAHAHAALALRHGEPRSAADGTPQRLVVIGMGKLGAGELNLSSDIDLIFAFPESGETDGRHVLDNQEFFVRLGQRVIRSIDARTRDGFVFRVDMRLRPWGEGGALALGFDAMEQYYQSHGRDWERYAMVKARAVAGDRAGGARLLARLRPFTYRRYIDFGAIEALRAMKSMINREVQRRGKTADVKLGSGGIREIEFIVQSFQLIRGGREPRLQERAVLGVLGTLGELGCLPPAVVAELREAYEFLRSTEHALQAYDDQQTQALPDDETGRLRLAFALGYPDWAGFSRILNVHRANVSAHFGDVVAVAQEEQPRAAVEAWRTLWAQESDEPASILTAAGFEAPRETLALLVALRDSPRVQALQAAGRERLERFMPLLLAAAAADRHPSRVIARTLALVESVLRRSAYLVLLEENPAALARLVELCSASPWIAQALANQPVLLDELVDPRWLHRAPDRATLAAELHEHMLRVAPGDLEGQMEGLRYFKLAHSLRCAASEVTGALPLMKVSDYLSFLAEAILGHVLALAWHDLVARHGAPYRAPGEPCNPDFVIIAYGKLGGIELGHGSDLDLVFLHDADESLGTDGPRPIEASVFFTRLGQRIIHILTAYTALGQLYEVDMRLRPSGASGLLVSSFRAFRSYQQERAWTWEHQALVRARPVAGCERLAERFERLRCEVLALAREPGRLREEVVAMREKMRTHLLPADCSDGKSPSFHLKQSVGGIVDIEFMVQYCVLAWSGNQAALSVHTDNIRILEALSESGLMTPRDAHVLTEAYKAFRAAAHRLALQQQDEIVPAAEFQSLRDEVVRVWAALLGDAAREEASR